MGTTVDEGLVGDGLSWRTFAEEDFGPLAGLLARTWLAEFPGRAGRAASEAELARYLAPTTWSLVCESAGGLMGAVLVAERGAAAPEEAAWNELAARIESEAARDEELAEAMSCEMGGVDEEAALGRAYVAAGGPCADAAVKLLIVAPEAKGLGIGRRLFSAAREHMRERGARGYHLLTDDSCDVGFYEHAGLERAMQRRSRVTWPGVDPAGGDFHVYVYEQRL